MDYENNILEEKMKSLPKDLQAAMVSTDITNYIQEIAQQHDLNIDQSGQLEEVISLTILGIIQSKNFVTELSSRAEIDRAKANEIADDVNTKIFDSIRDSLRKMQMEEEQGDTPITTPPTQTTQPPTKTPPPTHLPPAPAIMTPYTNVAHSPETLKQAVPENMPSQVPIHKTISSIEKAGQFTVERNPLSSSPQYKEENINRETMLKHIEDAPVPLVDHLLANPVSNPNEAEVKTTEPVKTDEKKAYTMDPYREAA